MSVPLSLRGVSAGYEGRTVVHNISFELSAGEFCALLGRNGSGKTTLLKAICGLLPVSGGTCLVDGLDCTHFHEHRRAKYISYIPQRHSKLQGVTVLDSVLMGTNARLGALEYPSASDRALALDALGRLGLVRLVDKDFARLSEGQKQLVILARSLVQNAPVMLMDEPDSALDFTNRHQMLKRLRHTIHSGRKAGLVTLHDPNLALGYCDRLIMLHNGTIISDISLSEAGRDDIQRCLSEVYGDITLIENCGGYIVLAPEADIEEPL